MFHGGTTLSSKNPEIMFMANGLYTISLKIKSSCFGSDSVTKTDYVNIGKVGLPTELLEASVTIYPNPNKGIVNISNDFSESLKVSIYDMQGKQVAGTVTSNRITVMDVQTLPKGMYIVKVQGESSSLTRKIVLE
jgi:PKD repeat protein